MRLLLLLLLLGLLPLFSAVVAVAVGVAVADEDSARRMPSRADFEPTWGLGRKSAARATHLADNPGSAAGVTIIWRVQQKCTNRTGVREITSLSLSAGCIVDVWSMHVLNRNVSQHR